LNREGSAGKKGRDAGVRAATPAGRKASVEQKRRPVRAAFFVHPKNPYKPVKGLAPARHAVAG
jgi:hypothetical protein